MKKEKSNPIYYELLRKMSGDERFKRALELCRLVWRITEDSIRNQFPNISKEELKEKLKERIYRWKLKR
ncbi:MAG: hypothetical protein ABIK80_06870 [candidate division WOR-3 bacterium]